VTVDSEWADVWVEYRLVFEKLGLDEAAAKATVCGWGVDPDRLADCLKEFVVLADERGRVKPESLRQELCWALAFAGHDPAIAVQLFGSAAEVVGHVLPQLPAVPALRRG
jgi:hypothetical protein